jgi:hypothetical protein
MPLLIEKEIWRIHKARILTSTHARLQIFCLAMTNCKSAKARMAQVQYGDAAAGCGTHPKNLEKKYEHRCDEVRKEFAINKTIAGCCVRGSRQRVNPNPGAGWAFGQILRYRRNL